MPVKIEPGKYGVISARATLFLPFLIFCLGAEAGLPEALVEYGRGNYKAALGELTTLANKGDATAQYTLGVMNENGQGLQKNINNAATWYLLAADQGLADAQLKVGLMHEAGSGLPKNDNKAFLSYRWAASQGNAAAQNNLAMMYLNGKGTRQDSLMAMKWFERAAKMGDTNAQLSLGSMYATGHGIAEDLVQADRWFISAALKGNDRGKQNQQLAEGMMSPEQISEAEAQAMEWFLGHKVLRSPPPHNAPINAGN